MGLPPTPTLAEHKAEYIRLMAEGQFLKGLELYASTKADKARKALETADPADPVLIQTLQDTIRQSRRLLELRGEIEAHTQRISRGDPS